jgi:amidase
MAEVAHLIEAQAQIMAGWAQWFTGHDALLAPVSMTQAFAHQVSDGFGPVPQMARVLRVGDRDEPYLKNLLWPGVATFATLPSLVRPMPGGVGGLPAGVQMIGPYAGENTLFALGEAIDAALGGFVAPGGFA